MIFSKISSFNSIALLLLFSFISEVSLKTIPYRYSGIDFGLLLTGKHPQGACGHGLHLELAGIDLDRSDVLDHIGDLLDQIGIVSDAAGQENGIYLAL